MIMREEQLIAERPTEADIVEAAKKRPGEIKRVAEARKNVLLGKQKRIDREIESNRKLYTDEILAIRRESRDEEKEKRLIKFREKTKAQYRPTKQYLSDVAAAKDAAGKPLKPTDIDRIGGGLAAIKMLERLKGTVQDKGDVFGPLMGRIRGANPYDRDAQAIQALVNGSKQVIGKFLEGGVLRKEDEFKYTKILPTLSDTNAAAMAKIEVVRGMLMDALEVKLQALKAQGYSTKGLEPKDLQQKPAGKTEVKRFRSKSTGMTKIQYSDGSYKILNRDGSVFSEGKE